MHKRFANLKLRDVKDLNTIDIYIYDYVNFIPSPSQLVTCIRLSTDCFALETRKHSE